MRFAPRRPLALAAVCAGLFAGAANAQLYDEPDGPPPRPRYERSRRAPPARMPVGLNCDAVQSSFSGPKPFACPLAEPRPLGARCYCETPPAPFTTPQTLVGSVVP